MKKAIIVVVLLCTIVFNMVLCMACGKVQSNPPSLGDIYERAVELIENSRDINVLLFGAGLPVIAYGSPEAEWQNLYDNQSNIVYLLVAKESSYQFTNDIKEAVKKVYSSSYIDNILKMKLDGYSYESADGEMTVMVADYIEKGNGFYMAYGHQVLIGESRLYDYSSMHIIGGNVDKVKVAINSYLPSNPNEIVEVNLTFVLENGNWYLDSPTY